MSTKHSNSLNMRLQARLLLIVLDQKGQVFGPVVLEVTWEILVHVVFCYRDVQVRVQISRVFCKERDGGGVPVRPLPGLEVFRGPLQAKTRLNTDIKSG